MESEALYCTCIFRKGFNMLFNISEDVITPYYSEVDNTTIFSNDSTYLNYLVYSAVLPVISGFGIVANFINGIVLMRPKMTPSAFTYLATISWLDCTSCTIIFVSSLTKAMFRQDMFWIQCDVQLQTPVFGFTTGAANLTLVFVTLDRLIFLKKGLPNCTPGFCTKRVARIIIVFLFIIAALLNVPYFFIFVHKDGKFYSTPFFQSTFYMIHNWINFTIVAIFPAVFLMIGNSILVSIIKKWANSPCTLKSGVMCKDKKRYQYQIKLTTSLVAVICLFYVGNIPAHLVSRKSAISLLFNGDLTKSESVAMDTVRMVIAILNAFQLSVNIVVYAILNPVFLMELFECIRWIMLSIKWLVGIDMAVKYFRVSKLPKLIAHLKKLIGCDRNTKSNTVELC